MYFAHAVAKSATDSLPVTLTVAEDGSAAELGVDGAADSYYALVRNNWGDADGAALMRSYLGYYTVALPVLTKSSQNAPGGTGYLTLTVMANGTVTYAGQTADGKSLSGSAALLYGPDCCSAKDRATVYLLGKPSGYGRLDALYGLIYLEPSDSGDAKSTTVMPADSSLGLNWVNTSTKAVYGLSGFTHVVDVTGGYYDKTVNLQTYYGVTTLEIGSVFDAPANFDGEQGESDYWLVSVPEPARVPVTVSGASTLAFPKKALVKSGLLVDLSASVNPWSMAVSPNRATGIFSGSCTFYWQTRTGKPQQKTKDIEIKGVFLPVRAEYQSYADWMGFDLVPDVFQYEVGGKQETYSFDWSYNFFLAPRQIDD